MISIMRYI